ncbi:MAG: metal-dependent hydrolase [Polyangiaceae bacterium]|nr:metal-dependent hydrolase [Polyangiaceae bacterium]
MGLAVALLILAIARRRGADLDAADERWILGLGALGPIIHLLMDGLNIYGIHPFWPVYDGWIYGDAVFIVEPLLWLTAVPFLFADARTAPTRAVLILLVIAGLGLPWLVPGFVPLPVRIALLVIFAIMVVLARVFEGTRRAAIGLGAFFGVPVVFLAASTLAHLSIERRAMAEFPGEKLVDAATTSWPSNPLCWSAVLVSTTQAGDLVLRRVTFALTPSVMSVESCPLREEAITAPLHPVGAPNDIATRWEGEHRIDLARLRYLAESRCDVAALMRFMRAPFIAERGETFVVGDLRFDRDEKLDFAELELPIDPPNECPRFVPSWTPPRADILSP